MDSLTLTQKKFFAFWDTKIVMILPILERLKQRSAFGLAIIKLNTDLFEKENRVYYKSVFIHTLYKIATRVLMIGKSLYLRSVKHTSNWKHCTHFILI